MRLRTLSLLLCLPVVAVSLHAQTRRALLIGINLYQPPHTAAAHPAGCVGGRCDVSALPNLDGSLNDVAAMRDLLASPKFGFTPADVVVLTNPDLPRDPRPFVTLAAAQTTRDGILAAMRRYLVDAPSRGDTVVFYYAGHGSLRINSRGTKLTVVGPDGKTTHADSTLVAADAWMGHDDVLDRESTRIFNAALDKGVKLTVILDSCHSGGFTRGVRLGRQGRERMLPYDPRDIAEGPDLLPNGQPAKTPAERGALVYSAAQQDQTAKEVPPPDSEMEAHGAFTAALLKALESLPADAPAALVDQQVTAALEASGVQDQTPSLDAVGDRRNQPLFGGAAVAPGQLRAFVVGRDPEGNVVLDTGRLAGIGPGSTFVSVKPDARGRTILLKVKTLDGLARSSAAVLSPPGAEVSDAQLFELKTWVPVSVDALRVWTWPATLSQAEVQAAADLIRAAGVQSVDDPASSPWTDLLSWNGTAWGLQHAGAAGSATLGATLTPGALNRIPPGAKVWVNLPPPRELYAQLELHKPSGLVEAVDDVSNADYVLAGTLTRDGPSWAWIHREEFQKGPGGDTRVSPGCSATSHYPVRSDWVLLADASVLRDAAGQLNTFSARLSKLNGWLHLPSSPGGGDADYYDLAVERGPDQDLLQPSDSVGPADQPRLVLVSTTRVIEKRWVYVLDVDCRGRGQLLYPGDYTENEFPKNGNDQRRIELPGGPTITVNPPYGLDTLFLISTTQPLPDPWSLSFEGVATRGASSSPPTPLQQLLSSTSHGTRGLTPTMPTDWAVTVGQLRSVPGIAPTP
ncbi:MAG TPA: caspase family protein [Acidobacteriaceae bacterium]|nr:caspase family protein [Acidobacteriaceae bacterium]